jgi:hypothetical protein
MVEMLSQSYTFRLIRVQLSLHLLHSRVTDALLQDIKLTYPLKQLALLLFLPMLQFHDQGALVHTGIESSRSLLEHLLVLDHFFLAILRSGTSICMLRMRTSYSSSLTVFNASFRFRFSS